MTALTTQSRHNSRRSQSVRLVRWSFEGFEENPTSVYLYKGGYLSLFVLQVCSESELRKLVCVKIWNGMNLTSMQIFRSVILTTGYVTHTFHFTYSSSSKPKDSNCSVNKSRLACDFNIPRLRFGGQRSTFVDKQHVEIGHQNSPFHLPKNFIEFNCSRNIPYSDEYRLV